MRITDLLESEFDPLNQNTSGKARYMAARVKEYEKIRHKIGMLLVRKQLTFLKAIKPNVRYYMLPWIGQNVGMEVTDQNEHLIPMFERGKKLHDEIIELFMREDMPIVSVDDDHLSQQIESFLLDRCQDLRADAEDLYTKFELYVDQDNGLVPETGLFLRRMDYSDLPQEKKLTLRCTYDQDDIQRYTPESKMQNPTVKRMQAINAELNILKMKFNQLQER